MQLDIATFLRISDAILSWLEKAAEAKKREKSAREATTNEPVKRGEAGSPDPSLPSSAKETPKEEKVPATPQEETRPANEPAKFLEGASPESSNSKGALPWEIVRFLENPSQASWVLARKYPKQWERYLVGEVMLGSTTHFKFLTATEQVELLKQFTSWLAEEFGA